MRRRPSASASRPARSKPWGSEPVLVRRVPVGPDQLAVPRGEDVGRLDDVALDPARHGDDLAHSAYAVSVEHDVHDDVDAASHRGDDERRETFSPASSGSVHILVTASRALLAWIVHMPGSPGVQRDQQVEALLLAHLADDDPVGPHPQRLLDEPAQRDLAGALEAGLAGLHRDHVGQRHRSSKTSSQVTTRSRPGIAAARQLSSVVLPAWVPPATMMLSPRSDRRLEERRRRAGQRAQADQLVEAGGREDELADVDRPVLAGDVRDDDVQAAAVGQHRVDERRGQVDPAARGLEHPLDQVAHLVGGQDRRGQLVRPPLRATNTRPGLVDPDLLDRRVVEVALQRAEAGDRVSDRSS